MKDYVLEARNSLEKYYPIQNLVDASSPVKDIEIEALKNSRVVFQEEVWEVIQNIALTTQVDSKEIGF